MLFSRLNQLEPPPPLWRYGAAGLAIVLTLLLTWLAQPLLMEARFLFAFAAVSVVAVYGGLGPGLVTALCSGVGVSLIFATSSTGISQVLSLGMFIAVAALISVLTEARRRSGLRAYEYGERLRVTLQSIGDGVIVTDAAGRVTMLNEVAEKLTGWRQGAALGQPLDTVFRIVNEQTRQPVANPALHVLRTGMIAGLANHTMLISSDGREWPIDDSGAPVRGTAGQLVGVVLVFRDITERREAEVQQARLLAQEQAARQEAEAAKGQIEQILESITDGFVAVDRSWHFTYANHEGARTLRRAVADLLGKHLWEEFPELEQTSFGELHKRALAEGRPLELEDYYPPFDTWYAVRSYPYADGLAVYFRDITERRRIQVALQQSEQRYRAFIAQSTEGIWRIEMEAPVTVDRPEDEQIELFYQYAYLAECNDAMAHMYGYDSAQDLVGARLGDLLVRSDPANMAYLRYFIQSGYQLVDAESHERDRSGASRFFLNNLIGSIENGVVVRAWGTQRDITALKEAQQELERTYAAEQQARAEAEAALRLRDQFLSIAAHELRTPITVLLGSVQAVQRRGSREQTLDARYQRSLHVIEQQASRLADLITDLLDISRIQAGQFVLRRAPFDLTTLVQTVVAETQPTLERHTLLLQHPPEELMLNGDALRLEQVLRNLLDNAIKYSPEGGTITIRLGQQGTNVVASVSDEGIGIPQLAREQLFQRFFRAGNARAEQIMGLGLGLYVVHEIVTHHGGTVEVQSSEGIGSTFTICLPTALEVELPA